LKSEIPVQLPRMPEIHTQADETFGRRTERIMLEIPVRVLCFGGSVPQFSEDTHTIFVNRDGALIGLKHPIGPDETVRIINLENLREADFRVIGSVRFERGDVTEWGMECLDRDRTLWEIDFPPPLSAGGEKAGALLECEGCKKQGLRVLTLTEVGMLNSVGRLEQLCDHCGELTTWVFADVERRPKAVPPSEQVAPASQAAQWDGKRERRLHKRVALKLPALIRNREGQTEIVKTEDVSKGGIAVCMEMRLAVGDVVTAVCPYTEGGQEIWQKAEVRRRIPLYNGNKWLYGLRYVHD
jgi:hypothetical protein